MTTAQGIITGGYRELNITPIGKAPTADQLTEGLYRLNGYLRIIFGSKMGELLQDWEVPFGQRTASVAANFPQNPYPLNQDWAYMGLPMAGGSGSYIWPYPPKNSRLVFGGTQNTTVYFPQQPDDGSRMGLIAGALAGSGVTLTLDGNSRTIDGQPTQQITTPMAGGMRWIYRADLGDWRPIASLALTDEMPFPEDMDEYFVLSLARRLAPGNDKTMSAESLKMLMDAETLFKARYRQAGTTTYGAGEIPLSYESYLSGRYWW
jgi:hypothetical protein